MVLGSGTRQSTGHSIGRREPELVPKDHRARLHYHRMYNVDFWRSTFRRSAHILPPSAGEYTLILFLLIQTENNHSKYLAIFKVKMLLLSDWLTCHRRSGFLSLYSYKITFYPPRMAGTGYISGRTKQCQFG